MSHCVSRNVALVEACCNNGDRPLLGCRSSTAIAAELHAAPLGGCQRSLRASTDHAAFFIGP
jgi:hypothetical protein